MTLRLLLVEDNENDVLLVRQALARQGMDCEMQRVDSAAGMQAALADGEWDAIVSDYSLPGFGAEAALKIAQASGRDLPFILMSGTIGEEAAVELMRAGADDFVPKSETARLLPALQREIVDARERRERRAAQAQVRFQANLLQAVEQAVITTDLQGRITFWNRYAEKLYGWRADEVLGQSIINVTPTKQSAHQAEDIMQRLLAGETWQGEIELHHRDGETFPAQVYDSPLFDETGQVVGVVSVSFGIAERRQREMHLQALSELSAALRATESRAEMIAAALAPLPRLVQAQAAALLTLGPGGAAVVEGALGDWRSLDGLALAPRPELTRLVEEGDALLVDPQAAADELAWLPALPPDAALALAPLRAKDQPLGLLAAVASRPLRPSEVRLLANIADIAASAIHRVSLMEQAQARAEQFLAVSVLGQGLAGTLDLERIYPLLSAAVLRLLPGSQSVLISRYDERQRKIEAAYGVSDGWPLPATALPTTAYDAASPEPQCAAISQKQPVFTNGQAAGSGLAAPMLAQGQVVGVIQVASSAPGRFGPAEADLLALVANTVAVAISNANLFTAAARRLANLEALHDIDLAITASLDVQVTLNVFLSQATQQLSVDAASVLLLSSYSQQLEYSVGRGFRRAQARPRLRVGDGRAGLAVLERRTLVARDQRGAPGNDPLASLMAAEQFVGYAAVPLVSKGQVKGVLEVFSRQPLDSDPEWLALLEMLAGRAAVAVDNADLFNNLQKSNSELALAYDATIEGWARALDLRDHETEGHTRRVAELAMQLARAVGLADEELLHLRRGALLHDIGKMGLPDSILLKPGPLTDDECTAMRRHPQVAYDLLAQIEFLRPALDVPYCHHEKWDGSGYPRGLKGEQIPLAARVFAVIDVWDALCSDRPYRAAWIRDRVREHVRGLAGTHFDPRVVEAFVRLPLAEEPQGQ